MGIPPRSAAPIRSKVSSSPIMLEPPASVMPLFVAAGWMPGRRVAVAPVVPRDHPAFDVLRQVGGLRVGTVGVGWECARSDIEFKQPDDEVLHEASAWAELLGTTLIGVAEVHNHHAALLIDSIGRCFGLSYIHDAFYFEGHVFGEAVERLLLGRPARPMLRPDQSSIMLYGEEFPRGHPAIFRYRPGDDQPS